jgi:hypothetical protein
MGFGFFRTIWISLRAVNYTTQAFQDTVTGLSKLQQAQLRLKMDAARNMMAVGAMYVAMGGMAIMIITKIMNQSELGQKVLGEFGDSAGKSMSKLGDSFARVMGPLLNIVAKILELATANPIISDLLAGLITIGAVILIAAGAVKLFSGAIAILNLQLMVKKLMVHSTQQSLLPYIGATHGATGATMGLAAAINMCILPLMIGVGLFTVLSSYMGQLPAALFAASAAFAILAIQMWLAAGAMSVLSWGAAAIAGGAALAGAIAIASGAGQAPEYQMGTRMLTKTGPIIGHRGEVMYNPENQLPTQINNELRGGKATSLRQDVRIDLSGSIIQTKADKEELIPIMKRELRNIVLAKE